MGCNCGGSGQWQPPAESGQRVEAAQPTTGPAAPGYFAEPKIWNGPQPAPSKTDG